LKRGKSVASRKLASPSLTTSGSAIQDLSFSLTRPRRNFDTEIYNTMIKDKNYARTNL
jgi:hypothetical protein